MRRPVPIRRLAPLATGLLVCTTASAVAAQSFNQELTRYRAQKWECESAYRESVTPPCDARCMTAAGERKTQCLAEAERRYGAALRRALRPRQ